MRQQAGNGLHRPLVTVIQPYVTLYRVPLFEQLKLDLSDNGFDMIVAHGRPWGEFISRHDSFIASWSRLIRVVRFKVGPLRAQLRWSGRWARSSEIVVGELSSTNLDMYRLALRQPGRLILWGHGRPAVGRGHPLDERLEQWLARRAAHVLTYTDSGRTNLESRGVSPDRISVLKNSTDTRLLAATLEALDENDVDLFREQWRVGSENVVCFIGALDPTKRLDLLMDASRLIARSISDFTLLIAGDGVLRDEVERRAVEQPELRLLPYADVPLMARIGKIAQIMVMPGRVGLVATDALALGLPVITTDWPFHAPEREYLETSFCDTVAQDPEAFAAQVVHRLRDRDWLTNASIEARRAGGELTVERMSTRMTEAILGVAQNRDQRPPDAAQRRYPRRRCATSTPT